MSNAFLLSTALLWNTTSSWKTLFDEASTAVEPTSSVGGTWARAFGLPHRSVVSELGVNVWSVNSEPMSSAWSNLFLTPFGLTVSFDADDEDVDFDDDFVEDDDESVLSVLCDDASVAATE